VCGSAAEPKFFPHAGGAGRGERVSQIIKLATTENSLFSLQLKSSTSLISIAALQVPCTQNQCFKKRFLEISALMTCVYNYAILKKEKNSALTLKI
jgi:hypothetical protein